MLRVALLILVLAAAVFGMAGACNAFSSSVVATIGLPGRAGLSVLLVAFNKAHYLNRSLGSVMPLVASGVCSQLILVDDGSQDNFASVVAVNLPRLGNFVLFRNGVNLGTHVSRLSAVMLCETPFLVFLDPDDELIGRGIELAVSLAVAQGLEIVEFGCLAVRPDGHFGRCWCDPPVARVSARSYRELFFKARTNWHLHRKVLATHLYKTAVLMFPLWIRYEHLVRNEDRLQYGFLCTVLKSDYVFLPVLGELYFHGLPDNSDSGVYQSRKVMQRDNRRIQNAIYTLFGRRMKVGD